MKPDEPTPIAHQREGRDASPLLPLAGKDDRALVDAPFVRVATRTVGPDGSLFKRREHALNRLKRLTLRHE